MTFELRAQTFIELLLMFYTKVFIYHNNCDVGLTNCIGIRMKLYNNKIHRIALKLPC